MSRVWSTRERKKYILLEENKILYTSKLSEVSPRVAWKPSSYKSLDSQATPRVALYTKQKSKIKYMIYIVG